MWLISGIVGISTGAVLLVLPRKILTERTLVRRWLFEYSITAFFNRYHAIEKLAYRYHRPIGAIFTIGAVIIIVPLLGLYDHPAVVLAFIRTLGFWGTHILILASWLLTIFALIIGIFLFIRPSALRDFEMVANRWIEPFSSTATSSQLANRGFNRLALFAPRLTGLLLLISGLGCLLVRAI